MAGKKGWVLDEGGKEHPENGVLLAFYRGQSLEDTAKIHRHILQCPRCLDTGRKYENASNALGALKEIQLHLDYSDVPSERVFNRFQFQTAKYERRLSTRIMRRFEPLQRRYLRFTGYFRLQGRLSPVTVYAALILILLLTALAFGVVLAAIGALPGVSSPFRQGVSHITQSGQSSSVSLPQQRQVTPTASQGGQVSSGRIRDCTNSQDRYQSLLGICGSGFKPGDKVALLVTMPSSGSPKQRRTAVVDGHGKFELTISINHCNVPVAITVHDLTHTNVYSNTLQDIKFGGCRIQSPYLGHSNKNH